MNIPLESIALARDESLHVAFHTKTEKWWATVGPEKQGQRAVGTGDTPIAALESMLAHLDRTARPANGGAR
ncbi:hypothetical protein [Sphingobium chungangianum]